MQRRTSLLGRLRGWIVSALTLSGALGLFLFGVLRVSQFTRDGIRASDRYATGFADIECPPPPFQSRTDFLAEVQYLANQPARLHVLDEDLPRCLAVAFATHPWVRKVQRVEIVPPRQVRVRLTYRWPVLAVTRAGQLRAVDAEGVLLPTNAPTEGLLVLRSRSAAPAAGAVWGDPVVVAAARTAGLLQPHQESLRLTIVEAKDDGLMLKTAGGSQILWGGGPGDEATSEAAAARKCERLLEYCTRHGGLDKPAGPYVYDVRPTDKAVRRKR